MIGGEGDTRQAIELVQHAVGDATFILSYIDELAAAGLADHGNHGLHPTAEHILREEVVVDGPHLPRISMTLIGQVGYAGQRDTVKVAELLPVSLPRRLRGC